MQDFDKVSVDLRCSFCGKSKTETRTMITNGPNANICNECIELFLYIMPIKERRALLSNLDEFEIPCRDEINIEELGLKPKFKDLFFEIKKGRCSFLCPFSEPFNSIYKNHVKITVESQNHTIFRVDEIFGEDPILDKIWYYICSSELVLVDVTGRNPNVMYVLGMAHTIGKPILIISQRIEDVPFDMRHYQYIIYEYTERGCKELEEKIIGMLKSLIP